MLDAHALPSLLPFAARTTKAVVEEAEQRHRKHGLLHVAEQGGGGEPVVFLHGLFGSSRYWLRLLPRLTAHHRTLAVDLLGFGRSPWPECDYTPGCHVAAIERAVLPRLRGSSFHVVGHSTGADLALELAARHVDRVRSVSLLALPYFDSAEHARSGLVGGPWARFVIDSPFAARIVCETLCRTMQRIGPQVLPRVALGLPAEVVVDSFLHSFRSVYQTLHQVIVNHRVDEAAARLEAAGVPVTLFHDERDFVVPFAGSVAYRTRYRNARLRVLEGQGHLIAVSSGDEVGALLQDAFARPRVR